MLDIFVLSEYVRYVEDQRVGKFLVIKRSFLEEVWEGGRKGGRRGKGYVGIGIGIDKVEGGWRR